MNRPTAERRFGPTGRPAGPSSQAPARVGRRQTAGAAMAAWWCRGSADVGGRSGLDHGAGSVAAETRLRRRRRLSEAAARAAARRVAPGVGRGWLWVRVRQPRAPERRVRAPPGAGGRGRHSVLAQRWRERRSAAAVGRRGCRPDAGPRAGLGSAERGFETGAAAGATARTAAATPSAQPRARPAARGRPRRPPRGARGGRSARRTSVSTGSRAGRSATSSGIRGSGAWRMSMSAVPMASRARVSAAGTQPRPSTSPARPGLGQVARRTHPSKRGTRRGVGQRGPRR